jgi:hypothetical protein
MELCMIHYCGSCNCRASFSQNINRSDSSDAKDTNGSKPFKMNCFHRFITSIVRFCNKHEPQK